MPSTPNRLIWITMLSCLLFACSGAPSKRFYTLANDAVTTPNKTDAVACKLPLVIDDVHVMPPYGDDRIVFRSDAYEMRFFNYRHWVTAPEKMFVGLLQQRFDNSGLFSSVQYRLPRSREHLVLLVKLDALEEVDRNGGWQARLAMKFQLKDLSRSVGSNPVIWQYSFDQQRMAERKDVLAVVEAISAIYNEEMNSVIAAVQARLGDLSACQ